MAVGRVGRQVHHTRAASFDGGDIDSSQWIFCHVRYITHTPRASMAALLSAGYVAVGLGGRPALAAPSITPRSKTTASLGRDPPHLAA